MFHGIVLSARDFSLGFMPPEVHNPESLSQLSVIGDFMARASGDSSIGREGSKARMRIAVLGFRFVGGASKAHVNLPVWFAQC
jgi:hypothetical protein